MSLFNPTRDEVREFFFGLWAKSRAGEALTPLESMALAIVLEHPEYHEVLGDPDLLVEIADWESAAARDAHLADAAATGAYAPLVELLAAPFRVSVLSELPSPATAEDVRR